MAADMLPVLERLCSAKRTVVLTEHQAETWLASLSIYDPRIVAQAVIEIAHSDDPFPDLGKLTLRCEEIRRQREGTIPPDGVIRIGTKTLARIAQAWGVQV